MSISLIKRLAELEAFRQDFEAGAYPQRSALGPGTISRNFIKSKSISASMLDVSNLEAVSAQTGNLTVDGGIVVGAGGYIRSGLTHYSTDTSNRGFWLGTDGTPKLLIGGRLTATTPRLDFNGTSLEIIGAIKAESGYLKTMTISGELDLNSSGAIKSGKTGYGSGTGIWIDYNGGSPRFDIGSSTNYVRYSGGTLTISGQLVAATGTFSGSLSAATGTFSGGVTASSLSITGTANFSGAGSLTLPGGGSITSGGLDINAANVANLLVDGSITVSSSGDIRSGKSAYGSGTGWILEYNGGTPRFDVGSTSAYMRWNGSSMVVKGRFEFGTGDYLENDIIHFETGASATTNMTINNGGNSPQVDMRSIVSSTFGNIELLAKDTNNTLRSSSLQLATYTTDANGAYFALATGTASVTAGVGITGFVGNSASNSYIQCNLPDASGGAAFRVINSSAQTVLGAASNGTLLRGVSDDTSGAGSYHSRIPIVTPSGTKYIHVFNA